MQSISAIKQITVVEPSLRFLTNFQSIMVDGSGCTFHYLKSVNELGDTWFDTASLAKQCNHVNFFLINQTFKQGVVNEKFDLAICLNVLDQCESPEAIITALKEATAKDGILVVSCSYQWNKNRLINEHEAISDINEYFDTEWTRIAEDNHEYKLRFNERYSKLFLTHIVAYQKE